MRFELHPKQTTAFRSLATEILYGGAAGGGKSHLMRVVSIYYCLTIAGLQVYLFRRISEDLAKNHLDGPTGYYAMCEDLTKSGFCSIVNNPTQVKFANGSKIHLCHCQYEKDKHKYQGAEIHVLLIDELTHFTDSIYRYLRARCRVPKGLVIPEGMKLPFILAGSNPGNIGHNWVKSTFISPKPAYECWKTSNDEGGFVRQFIPALLDDNPSLDKEEYERTLSGLGAPHLVKAMRDGDWDIVAGGMFDDVWNAKIHIIQPFKIPDTWRLDRSFDWGSSKPYSVGWWAESDGCDIVLADGTKRSTKKGDLFRIAELYGWTGKPNEGTKELAKEVAVKIRNYEQNVIKRQVFAGPADTSIWDKQDGHCIADNMAAEGIHWKQANKSPGSRINGWELMRERLSNSKTREGPGLFVFDNCRQFIRTVPVLPRDEKQPDDVDTSAEDHVADEARYRITVKIHKTYRN